MEKKVAIVTGSSRGIGKSIALTLAQNGYNVVLSSRSASDDSNIISLMEEINSYSKDSIYVQCDISIENDRKNLIDTCFDKFSKLDVLVNNAGVAPKERNDILEMNKESMDYVIGINLYGPFFLTQYASNMMIKHNCGSAIINITSMSAYTSSTNRGEYCISKAGASMIVTLFADRLAEYGINVYELRPGIIDTDMVQKVKDKYETLIDGGLLPIKRMGTGDDVAKAVLALSNGSLPYSTGEVINIDGGFHIRRL